MDAAQFEARASGYIGAEEEASSIADVEQHAVPSCWELSTAQETILGDVDAQHIRLSIRSYSCASGQRLSILAIGPEPGVSSRCRGIPLT